MKKLFEVGGKFFGSKSEAKAYQREHGGIRSYGPDHKKYNAPPKTHNGTKGHKEGRRT